MPFRDILRLGILISIVFICTQVNVGGCLSLPLSWLHIPKAGSTFGLSVLKYACPGRLGPKVKMGCGPPVHELRTKVEPLEENCQNGLVDAERIDMHPPAKWPEDKGHIVGMFRKPEKLKISFIKYLRKLLLQPTYANRCGVFAEGFLSASGLTNSTLARNLREALLTDNVHEVTRHLQLLVNLLIGCQTKMILGYPCLSDVALSSKSLQNATKHLSDDFAFIGIVERWKLSIRLFGSMFQGTRVQCLLRGELMNGRRGNRSPLPYDLDFTDPYDSVLYLHVRRVFYDQLSKYPIKAAAIKDLLCPR